MRSFRFVFAPIAYICMSIPLASFARLDAASAASSSPDPQQIVAIERDRTIRNADAYLSAKPVTVTASHCPRSAGGLHDFYSEGDYWWPDPKNPDGPYIQRDGMSNPDNFNDHRKALIRFSDIVASLTSAYLVTKDPRYLDHAIDHLKAWFIDQKTKMNPSLLYAQAISGVNTGRSIGVIDTIHLVEVARSVERLKAMQALPSEIESPVTDWFATYLRWLNEHPYGQTERDHPNNHGVCWSMQAAAFARVTDDQEQLAWIRQRFKEVYLGKMMDARGGFPKELGRTKPYGYSLFVIDSMATVATLASNDDENLWTYTLPDGRGMRLGLKFIAPYVADKSTWPLPPDVLYWDEWPARHPSLIFGTYELDKPEYKSLWVNKDADPRTFETLRNLPVRHPVLWIDLLK